MRETPVWDHEICGSDSLFLSLGSYLVDVVYPFSRKRGETQASQGTAAPRVILHLLFFTICTYTYTSKDFPLVVGNAT